MTVYVTDDPRDTLGRAGLPTANETVAAYGAAWLALADSVGQQYGVEIDAVLTGNEALIHERHNLNDPADLVADDGPSVVMQVWQAMHDAVPLAAILAIGEAVARSKGLLGDEDAAAAASAVIAGGDWTGPRHSVGCSAGVPVSPIVVRAGRIRRVIQGRTSEGDPTMTWHLEPL